VAALTLLSGQVYAAIGYSKGVYEKKTIAPGDTTGEWTTGNAGSFYLENQWAYYQYMVTGITTATGVPSFDVTFNHFQSGTNAIFVDAFANFRACLNCTDSAKTTGPQGQQGMLLDGVPFPPASTTNWRRADPAFAPGVITNINRPFIAGACSSTEDAPNTPSGTHCFHVDGAALKTLVFGADPIPAGTHRITLFYAAHLAATSVWSAGNEHLLGCTTNVATYVAPFPATMPDPTAYGTDAYSGGDPCSNDDIGDWTTAFRGVAAATGSSRHFSITNQTAGSQGGLTLPIPTVEAQVCPPTSPCCLPDGSGFQPATTICRPSAGVCDVAESCTGTSADCPADAKQPATTICRASAGICDAAESCDGVAAACPADGFAAATTICRASAGVCDVAESCTGTGAACPADGFAASTTICRASAGVCDVAESCTGTGAACPADAFVAATTTCRASAGVCDVAESCTGTGAACPADAFVAATTICRASAGVCDVAESCTGTGANCPDDAFVAATTICRAATTECDPAESCTGTDPLCPADVNPPCVEEACRTVGYWGTHAGTENNSVNITQLAITANGGSISVCGLTLGNTDLNSAASAEEVLCDGGGGPSQLQRQLTAMALNCVASGSPAAGAACDGVALFETVFNLCDGICQSGTNAQKNACIGVVDCLNNGGTPSLETNGQFFCATGSCSDNSANCSASYNGLCGDPATATCTPYASTCHDVALPWPDSPASSPNKCNDAKKTQCNPGITSCPNS
jgi:hypothetical protein